MKRIEKTERVMSLLRASYGPDANLSPLVVFEAKALNTRPIRKTSGLFKGARTSPSTLFEAASALNRESVPIQIQHDTGELPSGRAFYGEVVADELRVLFAIDESVSPNLVANLDSGTIDQVSVGLLPKTIKCSQCDFNYTGPNAMMNLWNLECNEGHKIGEEGTFVWLDGLESFFELSLVGMGAAEGARIVGPSEAVLQQNPVFQQRLAANANSHGVRLFCTPEDPEPMNAEQLTAFQAAVSGQAMATANLAAMTNERDQLAAQLQASAARIAELEAANGPVAEAQANLAAAVEHLQGEARMILTAAQVEVPAELPGTVAELTALIATHRSKLTAVIPVEGRGDPAPSDVKPLVLAMRPNAFQSAGR
jgi:hypothetical protein